MSNLLEALARHIAAGRWNFAAATYEMAIELVDTTTLAGRRQLAILRLADKVISKNLIQAA